MWEPLPQSDLHQDITNTHVFNLHISTYIVRTTKSISDKKKKESKKLKNTNYK